MEIRLAPERMFQLLPQVTMEQATAKVEEKKVSMVAGLLGNLFARPKAEDITRTGWQYRLEPFWHVAVHMRTVYDRQKQYTVPASGTEVKRVTLFGQTVPTDAQSKSGPTFSLTATEHCEEDQRVVRAFTGDGAPNPEVLRLVDLPKAEVADPGALQGEGVVLVPPGLSSTALVRQVVSEVVRPVKAQLIHEEQLDFQQIDLYVRPVYAFEFHWASKGKRAVLECDGLTGEVRTGGPSLTSHLRSMFTRDVLFDLSADAIGMVVPGGSIAVKLTKAAIDLKR